MKETTPAPSAQSVAFAALGKTAQEQGTFYSAAAQMLRAQLSLGNPSDLPITSKQVLKIEAVSQSFHEMSLHAADVAKNIEDAATLIAECKSVQDEKLKAMFGGGKS